MTFLAVRRWFGWSSGRLLVVDIGGGSLELAAGLDEEPDVALQPAAGRRPADPRAAARRPAARAACRELRAHVRAELAEHVRPLADGRARRTAPSGRPRRCARSPGSPAPRRAPRARSCRAPSRATTSARSPRAPDGSTPPRARSCPGVSEARARQLLAGALVAEAALDLLQRRAARHLPVGAARGRHPASARPPDAVTHRSRTPGADRPEPPGRVARCRMTIRVGLSTASLYPDNAATAFETRRAARLRRRSRSWSGPTPSARRRARCGALSELHGMPVVSVHAPTPAAHPAGLGHRPVGQARPLDRRWPTSVGAGTVVLHPPFRWQREYAARLRRRGRAARATSRRSGSRWRTCTRWRAARPRGRWPTSRTGTRSTSPTTT